MSLETQIAALVEAANNLTGSVNGKVGEIDQRMNTAEAEFDEWRNQKDVEGDPLRAGTIRRNIAQGHIFGTGGTSDAPQSDGIFPSVDLGTNDLVYVHLKTPLNVNQNTEMFWFNIKGYSYGAALIIDETIVGYSYSPSGQLLNKASFGNLSPDSYVDVSGNIILRLKLPSSYYATMRVDTMRVGNGRLFSVGDLVAKLSLADTVVF